MRALPWVVVPSFLFACQTAVSPVVDAGADASADAGNVPGPSCTVSAPLVAGTPETDALADAPARCGAPAYRWLRAAQLGDVVSRDMMDGYRRGQLEALATAGGVTLPRPLERDVTVERVVYVTQDRGSLVESSMVLAYPSDDLEPRELPVLLFLHGTSGFTRDCGPSSDVTTRLLLAAFASFGWIVVAPDYLGLESVGERYALPHPYLVGEATAIASLDAARAAAKALAAGSETCASTRTYVVGGSQGGHAALWVDRLAPYYARELDLRGVVATVPPSDLLAHTERALTEVVSATANTIAMIATQAPWYGASTRIGEGLASPWAEDVPAALAASCDPSDALTRDITLEDVFAPSLLEAAAAGELAAHEPFGCYLAQNGLTSTDVARLGPSHASYGILVVLGSNDTLVHTPIERDAYDASCAAGMPLAYLECEGASHTAATAWALPEIFAFLEARERDEPFDPICSRPPAVRCEGTPN